MKKKISHAFFLQKKGYSLLSLMVSVALLGILLSALGDFTKWNLFETSKTNQGLESSELIEELIIKLGKKESCEAVLKEPYLSPNDKISVETPANSGEYTGFLMFRGQLLEDGSQLTPKLTVNSIRWKDRVNVGGNKYQAKLVIQLNSSEQGADKANNLSREFRQIVKFEDTGNPGEIIVSGCSFIETSIPDLNLDTYAARSFCDFFEKGKEVWGNTTEDEYYNGPHGPPGYNYHFFTVVEGDDSVDPPIPPKCTVGRLLVNEEFVQGPNEANEKVKAKGIFVRESLYVRDVSSGGIQKGTAKVCRDDGTDCPAKSSPYTNCVKLREDIMTAGTAWDVNDPSTRCKTLNCPTNKVVTGHLARGDSAGYHFLHTPHPFGDNHPYLYSGGTAPPLPNPRRTGITRLEVYEDRVHACLSESNVTDKYGSIEITCCEMAI